MRTVRLNIHTNFCTCLSCKTLRRTIMGWVEILLPATAIGWGFYLLAQALRS